MWSSQPSESRSSSMVFFISFSFSPSPPRKNNKSSWLEKTQKKNAKNVRPKKKSPDPTTTSILWLPPKRRWCRFEWVQKSSQLPKPQTGNGKGWMDGRGSAGLIDEGQTSENMGRSSLQKNISKSWEKGNHRLTNGLVGDFVSSLEGIT